MQRISAGPCIIVHAELPTGSQRAEQGIQLSSCVPF